METIYVITLLVLFLSEHVNFIISNDVYINISEIESVMWTNSFLFTFHIPVFLLSLQYDELQDSDEQTCLQWVSLVSFLIRMKDSDFNISIYVSFYTDSCVEQMKNFGLIY